MNRLRNLPYVCIFSQIVIGDCLTELDKLTNENVQFDFVFSDLTDIPLSTTPQNKEWQFLLDVMEKSLAVLKPNGQFLTHVRTSTICSCFPSG